MENFGNGFGEESKVEQMIETSIESCFPILKILISMKRFFRRRLMVNKWSVTGQLMVDHWSDHKERVLVVRAAVEEPRILVGSNKISRWFELSLSLADGSARFIARRVERNDVKRRVSARMMDFMKEFDEIDRHLMLYKIESFVCISYESIQKKKKQKKSIHIFFHTNVHNI